MIIENKYGRVILLDDEPSVRNKKKIGIGLSGGTDSALIMYFLLRKIQQENLNISLIPFTSINYRKPFNEYHAKNIVSYFRKEFPTIKIDDHLLHYHYANKSEGLYYRLNYIKTLFETKVVDMTILGTLINQKEYLKNFRGIDVKKIMNGNLKDMLIYLPLIHVNKKFIAEEYHKNLLMEDLFLMTRSCSKITNEKPYHTKHWIAPCKKCTNCSEKKMVFGMYDGGTQ